MNSQTSKYEIACILLQTVFVILGVYHMVMLNWIVAAALVVAMIWTFVKVVEEEQNSGYYIFTVSEKDKGEEEDK